MRFILPLKINIQLLSHNRFIEMFRDKHLIKNGKNRGPECLLKIVLTPGEVLMC